MPLVPQKDKFSCKNIGGMIIILVAEFQAEYDKLYKENSAYRAIGLTPEKIATLKTERDGRFEIVCDKLCKYPERAVSQEELDVICEKCPMK